MGMKFNPVSGQFDLVGSGVSIGDTVGGTPANGGILYADNSDTLRANHWSTGTSSYAGGAVTGIKFEQQVIADAPRFEVLNLSGFGIPNAFALATSTDPFSFFLTDTDTLTTYVAMTINPATPASSNVTFGLASGTSSNPEFALTTTSLGLRVPVDMNTNKITELDTPTAGGDAVNKTYADAIIPSQTGNSGKYLTTNGSAVSWGTVSASPGGSDTQIQFNSSGSFAGDSRLLWVDWAWGGGAFGKYLQVGTSSQGQGILMPKVNKESWVAIGPQGNYGNDYARDEPHIALNTIRISGDGSSGIATFRNASNGNTIYVRAFGGQFDRYVTASNGIIGFYLTENGGNNAATITAGPTDQGFFARKARLQAQCETGLISADATINTIQAKGQTSQTGDLYSGADASANIVFRVDQSGGAVFNENSTSTGDVRMEGDTDANLFFSDASADTVQIGSATTADSAKFYVNGKISTSDELEVNGALNHDGTTVGFYGVTPVARSSAYTPTNVTTDRSYDANATTIDELADVVGTLVQDLQQIGLIG